MLCTLEVLDNPADARSSVASHKADAFLPGVTGNSDGPALDNTMDSQGFDDLPQTS
jgi:hypothetical protein